MQDRIDAIKDPACREVIDELVRRIQTAQEKAAEMLAAVPPDLDFAVQEAIFNPGLVIVMGLGVEK